MLIVDIDGEDDWLEEDYELRHVGAAEECALRVGVEHAETTVELALDQHGPIILAVSRFLQEREARKLWTAVTNQPFAEERTLT